MLVCFLSVDIFKRKDAKYYVLLPELFFSELSAPNPAKCSTALQTVLAGRSRSSGRWGDVVQRCCCVYCSLLFIIHVGESHHMRTVVDKPRPTPPLQCLLIEAMATPCFCATSQKVASE
jgi:hypothetical protein